MNNAAAAYLAGYLERGGAIRIYVNRGGDDSPSVQTSMGSTSPIESAGIYVRVRAQDPAVLRALKGEFEGKLSKRGKQWQWQGWNDDAANLLSAILPYLKTGKRKMVVTLALEFNEVMARKRDEARGMAMFFTAEEVDVVMQYEATLKEITGSK